MPSNLLLELQTSRARLQGLLDNPGVLFLLFNWKENVMNPVELSFDREAASIVVN